MNTSYDLKPSFLHFAMYLLGEGNGTPLQCSCLENPRDGGAQWAAVYGVAQSRTRQATQQQQQPNILEGYDAPMTFSADDAGRVNKNRGA